MAVFRIEKNRNYTTMSNYHLRDKTISYRAKGLLSFMISLPDDWDYSINGLVSVSKESKKAVRSILKELEEHYYLKINQLKDSKGLFYYEYQIFEYPYIQKVDMGARVMEMDTQINTKKIITKNKDKLDKHNLNSLTVALIDKHFIEECSLDIFRYNDLFNELLVNYEYRDVVTAANYTIKRIIENEFKDEDNNNIINLFAYFKESVINNLERITNDIDLGWSDEYEG